LALSLEAGRRAYERGNLQALSKFIATARSAQTALGGAASAELAGLELLEAQPRRWRANFTVAAAASNLRPSLPTAWGGAISNPTPSWPLPTF
jgi:hypothetical protein